MSGLSLAWQLTTAWITDRRRQLAEQPSDRGADLLVFVIITAAVAGAAIVIATLFITKALDAANGVETK